MANVHLAKPKIKVFGLCCFFLL